MIPQQPDFQRIIQAGGAQWRGTRQEHNDVMLHSHYDPRRGMLIAMADGIGLETDAGDAARAAAAAIRDDFLQKEPMEALHRQTLRMIGSAHTAVRALNDRNEEAGRPPVGASAACVLIRDQRAAFSSAGNVRVFLIRGGKLLQLNREHLLSLEAEERDILSGGAPDIDPDWTTRVTALIGMDGLNKVDCQQTPVFLLPRDRVLVMSSGLYGVLSEEELTRLAESGPPQQAAEAIINRVRGMGLPSQSNVSVVLAQFGW